MKSDLRIQEIIAGCLQEKPLYQRALVDQFSGLLYVICYRYIGNVHGSQDALQECLTKIFLNLSSYNSQKGTFESWASTITIRHCLNMLNAQKSREMTLETYTKEPLVSDLEEEIMATIHSDQLMEFVAELPCLYRTIFNMAALDGYSHKEFAEALNLTVINSRTMLKRARKLLQEKITSQIKNESWVNTI